MDKQQLIADVRAALYCSKVCSYAQGMNIIKKKSDEKGWGVDLGGLARIWKVRFWGVDGVGRGSVLVLVNGDCGVVGFWAGVSTWAHVWKVRRRKDLEFTWGCLLRG